VRALAIATLTVGLLISAGATSAAAWGCAAHQAIAIAAERMLSVATRERLRAVLAASPIDPSLSRFCEPVPSSPLGDAATWADDFRAVDSTTGDWHFINIPRAVGDHTQDWARFCKAPRPGPPRAAHCIVDAIAVQYRTLTATSDPAQKATALRFITHLIGDLHQPLHAITNGDRGGNCFPIADSDQPPQEDERHNWRPNLHGVWDAELVRRLMTSRRLTGAGDLATLIATAATPTTPLSRGTAAFAGVATDTGRIGGRASGSVPAAAQPPTIDRVASWARASNALARTVAYGRLAVNPPIESAKAIVLASCDDNNHVGRRLAALHERITPAYQQASEPVVVGQLRLAAERLAAALTAAFP
jgi:hypothetical protein